MPVMVNGYDGGVKGTRTDKLIVHGKALIPIAVIIYLVHFRDRFYPVF